jgi:hypothetical protein
MIKSRRHWFMSGVQEKKAVRAVLATLAFLVVMPAMADTGSGAALPVDSASAPVAATGADMSAPSSAKPVDSVAPMPATPAIAGPAAPMPVAPVSPQAASPAPVMTTTASPATTPAAAAAPVQNRTPDQTPAAPEPNRIRTVYLNDSDRARMVKEIRDQVLQTAKDQNWAQPNAIPDWVRRIRFSGDIMFRGEGDMFDKGNSNEILNFQAMNSKGPTNIAAPVAGQPLAIPFQNTREDRFVPRLRVHIGMFAQVADDMEAIFRFSTGNAVNPGSATTTVGDDFARQNFLLDRAYMNYRPSSTTAIAIGRMASPWSTPTDMVWGKELSFDGVAMQIQPNLTPSTMLFATAGAFSVLSTDPNFPGNSIAKSGNHGEWLYGMQLGLDWQGEGGADVRGAIAYYDFADIQSQLSAPCYAPTTAVSCSTDNTVPAFMQKGNTVFAVRNLQLVNSSDPQYQYFGLASKFRLLNLNGTLDMPWAGQTHVAFDVDYVKNLGFNRGDILSLVPVNNFGSCSGSTNCNASYAGGNTGKQLQVRIGYPKVAEAGQWSTVMGYRDLQSDAVVDALNDQDFHLGGTNAKGYFLGGSLGFTHNAWVTARWLSATEDSGPPLKIDVLQIDVNARF